MTRTRVPLWAIAAAVVALQAAILSAGMRWIR